MSKFTMLAAGAAGYVLGAKAGRTRYEQIRGAAQKVSRNPKVREAARHAQDTVGQQAPAMKDKVASAASSAAAKVKHDDRGGEHAADVGWPADAASPDPSVRR